MYDVVYSNVMRKFCFLLYML